MSAPLLELRDVRTHFELRRGPLGGGAGTVRAVDGVSFSVHEGEVLGLVGESGCGKSTLARTILQLVPATSGTVLLGGRPLGGAPSGQGPDARGQIQMVFQDPYASLNPRLTVQAALAEPLLVHGLCTAQEAPARVAELMGQVGLSPSLAGKYPHEFSGGQRQRIAIARALALRPRVIVADEPVSALDVSVQAQILNLLASLCRSMRLGLVFIAHDLSVVRHISDRVAVMYLGRLVEVGPAEAVIDHPRHPYTQALVSSIPVPDPAAGRGRARTVLAGDPPSPLHPPAGCAFHTRCPHAAAACTASVPALVPCGPGREAACVRLDELAS